MHAGVMATSQWEMAVEFLCRKTGFMELWVPRAFLPLYRLVPPSRHTRGHLCPFDARRDVTNMLNQRLRDVILIARNHRAPATAVHVLVKLSVQQPLRLRSRGVKGEPGLVVAVRNAVVCDTALMDQPVADRSHCFGRRLEGGDYVLRGPIFAVI